MASYAVQESVFIINALHLSANLVLYYDYVLTFASEVEHFWGAPLTLGNVLFFINRYFTLFTTLIFLGIRTASAANEDCGTFLLVRELSLILAQSVVMAVLFLRTYALYNRSRKIVVILSSAVFIQTSVILIAVFGFTQHGETAQGAPAERGCQIALSTETAHRISVPWATLLALDVLIFALTLARTWHTGARDSLAALVRRDGALYFGAMALANLVNILAYWTLPPALKDGFTQFASCVSVTLAARLCLNLQRPPPPAEFTSVLPVLSAQSWADDAKARPETWASDLTVSGGFGDTESYASKDVESGAGHSEHSVARSPEVADWHKYSKELSRQCIVL